MPPKKKQETSTSTTTSKNASTSQQSSKSLSSSPKKLNFLLTLLLILIPSILLIHVCKTLHYSLPTPSQLTHDANTGLPIFSEKRAMDMIRYLGDTLGYRIVGTVEMDKAEDYVLKTAEDIKKDLDESPLAGFHEIEIYHQQQPGSHLFDFMDKKVWKKYFVGNVIVRLSDGTPESKENAILVNAHIDSTLPSPGAADDGAGVGVMMEALRVMAGTHKRLENSVVFLFNGGEESLQDASHLFITRHPLRKTIRAVINLEACGTDGPEILFQATSEQMIRAYSKVPHPFGTVLATEIFGTGILMSDTDFRQFVDYGNLTGLDMALIQNSYFYHTRRDLPDAIEPGALQHMGENVLALLNHLTSKEFDMSSIKPSRDTVFFSALGGKLFVVTSSKVASYIYVGIASAFTYLIGWGVAPRHGRILAKSVFMVPVSLLGSVLCANLVAFAMDSLIKKPLSWFRHEYYCLILFAPPTLAGMLIVQLLWNRYILRTTTRTPPSTAIKARRQDTVDMDNDKLEHGTLIATATFYLALTLIGQSLHIMSSYLFALNAFALLIGGLSNDNLLSKPGRVSALTYLISQAIPCMVGTEGLLTMVDLFVPLTGRMGGDAPADHIIATVVSVTLFMAVPMALPFAHRYGQQVCVRIIIYLIALTCVIMAVFSAPSWKIFDSNHPKRIFFLHMENVTSQDMSFHVATLDPAPAHDLLTQTAQAMDIPANDLIQEDLNTEIPEWDILFPVSQFLTAYKIKLPQPPASYHSTWSEKFKVYATQDRLNAVTQTRHLKLTIEHPEVIWPVISFEADVVEWDLPENPEPGLRRHHIKQSSSFGHNEWSVTMTIRLDNLSFQAALRESQRRKGQRAGTSERDAELAAFKIWFSGLDQTGFYPHHAIDEEEAKQKLLEEEKEQQGKHPSFAYTGSYETKPSMVFFERLESVLPDDVDASLWSAVSGVVKV